MSLADGRRVTYCCDQLAHRVGAIDEAGRLLFAFGERGPRPGQFDTPLDVELVAPVFASERLPRILEDIVWLAVADYGNRRVQLFELGGALVGTIDDLDEAIGSGPCRLRWRPPQLVVETADGGHAQIHLAAALFADMIGAAVVRAAAAPGGDRGVH
ncbi:MAG: hypothetical protein IT176_03890 [Acidobacteria bacterium]|nr:hypothetical protein [Acidobacteriota bacterium]